MKVPFNAIPANIRVPLFYAEVDNSQASYFEQANRTLLIGQKLAAGTADADTPLLVSRADEAKTLFGAGSMLARMHEVYRANDDFAEIWCIGLDEDAAGVKASGAITLTGPASAAGTLTVYVGGKSQRARVAVASGDSATTMASGLAAAINALTSAPVTASAALGVVTVTAKWKGETGNDITLIPNLLGSTSGEALPAGVTVTVVSMAGGATNPSLTAAIAAMGDEEYDHIILPFTDAASLDALKAEMDDITGRWSYARQIFGHVWAARRGSLGAQVSFGQTRNDPHASIADMEVEIPEPVWEMAAAYGAQNAKALNAAPHRPTQTLELKGVTPAPAGKRRTLTEKQSLLFAGMATTFVGGGALRVERAVTSYRVNAWDQGDPSYLDVNTSFQLAYILRFLRSRVTQKYGRHALANDGKRIGPGVVTPNIIRAEMVSAYDELERLGIVENAAAFAAALVVERDETNPNRVNVLYPPDLVNQLRVFAVLAQFRLQYPTA